MGCAFRWVLLVSLATLRCCSLRTDLPAGVSELCMRCPGAVRNGSVVLEACRGEGGEVVGRCCVESECGNCSAVVIGLDWSYCCLTSLHDYTFRDIGDTLKTLDVSGNNISVSSRAFGGLVNLTLLALPQALNCSDAAWSHANHTHTTTTCSHPVWPCQWQDVPCGHCSFPDVVNVSNVTDFNYTELCPPNSHCVPDGPGLHQCLCTDGYHGYKCLLQGYFPYITFFATSVGGALVVMATYWGMRCTMRLLP